MVKTLDQNSLQQYEQICIWYRVQIISLTTKSTMFYSSHT